MCEIQFIKNYNSNLTIEDFKSFKTLMTFGSFYNKDAYGVFNGHYSFKEKGRFNTRRLNIKSILKDNFIIGHNRMQTEGSKKNNENNHPFKLNDLILVHNGVINNAFELLYKNHIQSNIQTDSFCILALIDKSFRKNLYKNQQRQTALINAIKKTAEKLDGFYSVFICDLISKDIFYFKSKSTAFSVYEVNNILIASTNNRNLDYTYLDNDLIRLAPYKKAVEIEIKDGAIYLINDVCRFKEVKTFKEKKTIQSYTYGGYTDCSGFNEFCNKEYATTPLKEGYNAYDDKEVKIAFIDDFFKELFHRIPPYTFKNDIITIDYDKEIYEYCAEYAFINNGKIELDYNELNAILYS